MQTRHGSHEIDDDPARVDRDAAWSFLSQAYWNGTRTRDEFDRQLDGAWRLVGVYDTATGALHGFARALSDGVSTAYLADVFVLPETRGSGLGAAVVTAMIDDGPGTGMRWLLHTRDAHGLYARFGFAPPDDRLLERPKGFVRSPDGQATLSGDALETGALETGSS